MKRLLILLALVLVPPAGAAQPLAFADVAVIDVAEGATVPGMTVVITGERITAVGQTGSVEVPDDATVIDAAGKYLIPGLWDMHAHTTTDRNTREVIFPLLVAHGVTGIRSMAADCFETGEPNCEEEGSSATLATIEDARRRRREITVGDLVGPRVEAGSYYVNSPPPGEPSTPQYPRTAEHGREHARLLHARGVDFVKVYDMLSREAYFALADEADRLGLPFAGHVPVAVRASEASDAGQASIEHLGMGNVLEECSSREDDLRRRLIAEFQGAEVGARHTPDGPAILPLNLEMLATFDAGKCAALAERFVRNGTWVVPTLMIARLPSELGEGWREDPYARFLPPDERRHFEWAEETYARDIGGPVERAPYSRWVREVTRAMHRTGVPMLAGSDAGETGIFWGIGLHDELELLVSAGLTEAEALRTATLNPARFLGRTDDLGEVEEGKLADLVLLEANPLEDISNTQRIAAVVANGTHFSRSELDGLLSRAEAAAGASRVPSRAIHAQLYGDDLETAVRAEIEERHRQEQQAFVAGDCETVVSFYSDDATIYANGRRIGSLQAFREFCSRIPRPFRGEGGPPQISDNFYVPSEDAAHFVRTIDFEPPDDDSRLFKREVVTKVWSKSDDGWEIVHFHSSVHSVPVQGQESDRPTDAALPGLSELGDGWNTLRPGGETTCAQGDDFLFYARAADPARLVVYLYGGGGCWDAETCDPERETYTYTSTIEPARHPGRSSGIFDLDHPENPVAGYSMVAVPVCTGDAYLGDRDVRYTLETESGHTREFTVHHRGQTNAMAVMDWIHANFEAPREIFVAGSSAGAVGTPFYASLLAQQYTSARVVGLGDDGGSWRSVALPGADPGVWGIPDVLQRNRGWGGFEGDAGVEDLYVHAALTAPNLRLYQFDHAHDLTQRFYLELAGADDPDVLRHIRGTRRTIRSHVPEFRSFTAGGHAHTVLRDDLLYHYQTDGHRLRDWVAAIVAGEPVASVDCRDDCLRPGLVYGEEDLRVVERAIELLSAPGAWDPRDAPGACPARTDRYSLRCAVVQAALEVTGRRLAGTDDLPPAALDMIYTVTDRLGHRGGGDVVRGFNNRSDTTAADMIEVLEEVRERVRTGLPANR